MSDAKVIERIDVHGRILWLPPLRADIAIALGARLERLLAPTTSWDEAAEILDMRGISLRLNVEHHGPQHYLIWSLDIRDKTWAAGLLAELEA